MNEQSMTLGPLMKAARKFKKFNQSDVAQAIGCSQSALSKMEHNLLVPSAPQWFLFSRFTSIPPETIETGVIDRHSRVTLNNEEVSLGYKLPKRYRINRAQKVREVYPFLFYLEKKIDGEAFVQFIENVGIDEEFFLDFDNLVSFQLMVDMINIYIKLDLQSERSIKEIVHFGQNEIYWDRYGEEWKELKGVKELLQAFQAEQPFFQVDFRFHVDDKNNRIVASYVPEPHLYHFLKDVTDATKEWHSIYRKYTLEHLVKRTLGVEVEARMIPERSNSPLENHFEII